MPKPDRTVLPAAVATLVARVAAELAANRLEDAATALRALAAAVADDHNLPATRTAAAEAALDLAAAAHRAQRSDLIDAAVAALEPILAVASGDDEFTLDFAAVLSVAAMDQGRRGALRAHEQTLRRINHLDVDRSQRWRLDVYYGYALAAAFRWLLDNNYTHEARRAAFQQRDLLLAPWFADELERRAGARTARAVRNIALALTDTWFWKHAPEAYHDGPIPERYDLGAEAEAPLWNGAIRLRVPQRYVGARHDDGGYTFSDPEFGGPNLHIDVLDMPALTPLPDDVLAEAMQGIVRAAVQEKSFWIELRARPGVAAPCVELRYHALEELDWLVFRRWYLLRRVAGAVKAVAVSLNLPAWIDGREEIQAFVRRFDRAIDEIAIDLARLQAQ